MFGLFRGIAGSGTALLLIVLAPSPVTAQDSPANSDKAAAAARTIVMLAGENKLNTLWDKHTSKWFQSKTSKDIFLQNMSLGRAQFGPPQAIKLGSIAYSSVAPDFNGDIYTVTFETTYPPGKFYERIIVIKEPDGEFRLSGLWSGPAPKE